MLDYGIGNLHSAHKALQHCGADARLTADPALIADAAGVVLPGVGAFGACMDALRSAGLEDPSHDAVERSGVDVADHQDLGGGAHRSESSAFHHDPVARSQLGSLVVSAGRSTTVRPPPVARSVRPSSQASNALRTSASPTSSPIVRLPLETNPGHSSLRSSRTRRRCGGCSTGSAARKASSA